MAHKYEKLREKMSPAARVKSERKTREILKQLPLYDLRRARKLSQQTLAEAMGVPQSSVSKIERRADAYVSTLRNYLNAMGGQLQIFAAFPDGERVEIDQFRNIGEPDSELVEA